MPASLAERLFARLLHVYPASFRARFGAEMRETFRDQLRAMRGDAMRPSAWVGFWVVVLTDLLGHGLLARVGDALVRARRAAGRLAAGRGGPPRLHHRALYRAPHHHSAPARILFTRGEASWLRCSRTYASPSARTA